jgi:hypothetical protein
MVSKNLPPGFRRCTMPTIGPGILAICNPQQNRFGIIAFRYPLQRSAPAIAARILPHPWGHSNHHGESILTGPRAA